MVDKKILYIRRAGTERCIPYTSLNAEKILFKILIGPFFLVNHTYNIEKLQRKNFICCYYSEHNKFMCSGNNV